MWSMARSSGAKARPASRPSSFPANSAGRTRSAPTNARWAGTPQPTRAVDLRGRTRTVVNRLGAKASASDRHGRARRPARYRRLLAQRRADHAGKRARLRERAARLRRTPRRIPGPPVPPRRHAEWARSLAHVSVARRGALDRKEAIATGLCAMAKRLVTDACSTSRTALRLHGGYGCLSRVRHREDRARSTRASNPRRHQRIMRLIVARSLRRR